MCVEVVWSYQGPLKGGWNKYQNHLLSVSFCLIGDCDSSLREKELVDNFPVCVANVLNMAETTGILLMDSTQKRVELRGGKNCY